jgi:hypothetical protein
MRPVLLLLFLLPAAFWAQSGPLNAGFEQGSPGELPEKWFVPPAFQHYPAAWATEGCAQGKGCVEFHPGPDSGSHPGNLMQSFDAATFRGKLVRYRAAVKTSGGAYAGLWLRVDRPGGVMGFFDNMMARPIRTGGNWQYFEIDGFVHSDAANIALGLLAYNGAVGFDDVSVVITGDIPKSPEEPPRPLTDAGLRNLAALAKLFGVVRHFHPGDEAAAVDWNIVAIEAVRNVEDARSPAQLASALQRVFAQVAPTVRVYLGDEPKPHPALSPDSGAKLVRVHNVGFGQGSASAYNIYRTTRVTAVKESWKPEDIYRMTSATASPRWSRSHCSPMEVPLRPRRKQPWWRQRSAGTTAPPASPMSSSRGTSSGTSTPTSTWPGPTGTPSCRERCARRPSMRTAPSFTAPCCA